MEIIDTHAHLYLEEFEEDRTEVINRAMENGIIQCLLPNIDSGSISGMLKICSSFPEVCKPMMGLHPGSVHDDFENELKIIEDWLQRDKYVAIGEIGIDLFRDKSYREQQLEAFKIQIQWAKKSGLPVVIHARESFREIFNILDRLTDDRLKGVFHSFTGNEDQVRIINGYGFYFGINGIITYKNTDLVKTVEKISPERVLLETDSPYLSPVPRRGKRNESSNLVFIAERLAQIYNITTDELSFITTRNATELFNLKK